MNTIQLIGRLCYETEAKKAANGDTVYLNNVVAINRSETETDFIPIVAFNGTAEFIAQHFDRGHRIGIVGRLTSSDYEDDDGNKRRQLTVVVTAVDFCESPTEGADTSEAPAGKSNKYSSKKPYAAKRK